LRAIVTAALTTHDLNLLPLSEIDLASLETLFNDQCAEWLQVLRWDYTAPSALIRDVARRRELPGVAIVSRAEVAGCAFWLAEGGRCSVGDIYVAPRWRATGADRQLAAGMLDQLEMIPRLRRIESQCPTIGIEGAYDVIEAGGFQKFYRHYMLLEAPLSIEPASGRRLRLTTISDVEIRSWRSDDFDRAALIVFRSYRDEHDKLINSQYRSEEGCADLLSVLTEHVWCGEFLPAVSRVAVNRETGRPVGVLVALRIAPGTGHIGQISILPEYQGAGIGRRMIAAALAEFDRLRFEAVSLAVTLSNSRAYRLYESCGFRTIHIFPVFVRERQTRSH
jgi:ribosomal protein S18 acetylase RimI-like enzyme